MTNYNQALEMLKKYTGTKITICALNSFGFPFSLHCVLNEVEPLSNEGIILRFKQKRKRSEGYLMFSGNQSLVVYSGYHEINTEMYVQSKISQNGCTIKKSRRCFSSDYLDQMTNSTSETPICYVNTPQEKRNQYDLNEEQKKHLDLVIKENGNRIPERLINVGLGLTPRHVTQNYPDVIVSVGQ